MLKQRIKHITLSALMVMATAFAVVPAQPAFAAVNPADEIGKGVTSAGGGGVGKNALGDNLKIVVNVLLFALGAISVIMIVIGGIRYSLSAGDQSAITAAKNTILYAVVGLVVALLAYAIVNWVLGAFK